MCPGCPFNFFSEESEYVQNMGCLPTPYEIVEQHSAHGKNWACHETKKLCGGFVGFAKRKEIVVDLKAGLNFDIGVHGNIPYDMNLKYGL